MSRVSVKPNLLSWAIERSGVQETELYRLFPRIGDWLTGKSFPTFHQLERFARTTLTPLGYFFLQDPPEEILPIPNFRTFHNRPIEKPSPNLWDTLQTMQRRQNWMRDFLIEEAQDPLPFVGGANLNSSITEVVENMRKVLGLSDNWAKQYSTWQDAFAALRDAVDATGILLAKNGIVGNNTHRKLDREEFRGFVLVDKFAPLIFVNGADYEGAQMFTVAHELAHVWVGSSAVFNLLNLQAFDNDSESFCDKVAAEFLVPEKELRASWPEAREARNPYQWLARQFKVSPLVIARRALDTGFINRDDFVVFYQEYKDELDERAELKKGKKRQGGDFYNSQNVRVGKRFAAAVIQATKEGRLLYRDAFQLTDLYGNTFDKYSQKLGF